MWYGTDNGLCRDDGYRVTVFHSTTYKSVNAIAEDSVGRIWVATDKGAWAIDKKDYSTITIDPERLGDRPVQSVYVTRNGDTWVNQQGKLLRYDKELNWKRDYAVVDRGGAPTYVSGFCQDRDGNIYMTSYSRGVYRYDDVSDAFLMYRVIDADVPLGEIFQDYQRDYFWIRDFRGAIYRFDPYAESGSIFVASYSRPYNSPVNYWENLFDMDQDDRYGYIWAISRNNLMLFRPESDGTLTPIDNPILSHFSGRMMSTLLSTPGAMWIGSLDSESEVVHLDDKNMQRLSLSGMRLNEGAIPTVSAMIPADVDGRYWMLQDRIGLLLYDFNNNRAKYHDEYSDYLKLRLRMAEQMARSRVHNGVWVSQERSLTLYGFTNRDMNLVVVDSVKADNLVDPTAEITYVLESSRGIIWIGTTDGVFGYDLTAREFMATFPGMGYISGIVETPGRKVYVLSKEQGLYEIAGNKKCGQLPPESQVINGSTLAVAPDGLIWIGTDDGKVVTYDPTVPTGFAVVPMGGEPQCGVKQIFFSVDGHGWIVNDSRLIEFNPATGQNYIYKSSSDMPLFRVKGVAFPSESRSDVVVYGAGGVVDLKSSSMLDVASIDDRPVVTDIIVDGMSVMPVESGNKYESGTLTLEPDARNIEIYFSALDYRQPSKSRFMYRIKGYDNDWQCTERGVNRALYTSLPKGKYHLEVKYIDEYNRTSSDSTLLVIDRLPHWWETWWAFTLYLLLLAALVGAIIYYNLHRVNARNEAMWSDSQEMIKMRSYLQSPVTLPEEEFQKLDKILLDKATKAVESNMDDPDFDVNALASAVNMSRSTLARKLKSITGKTPLDFIREIKMQHACNLLRSRNYTISQVAEMLGFSDRRYFTSCFRKEMGMTPRDYQTQNTPTADPGANS
ncbi:MAG: helix-turn-helix domain-containing protein [Clostridiales bacterium]|nr:helix-turn-helix domain-containing protein [Clostridiales bacterium]